MATGASNPGSIGHHKPGLRLDQAWPQSPGLSASATRSGLFSIKAQRNAAVHIARVKGSRTSAVACSCSCCCAGSTNSVWVG